MLWIPRRNSRMMRSLLRSRLLLILFLNYVAQNAQSAELTITGTCGAHSCLNNGHCKPLPHNSFKCECDERRFAGRRCEHRCNCQNGGRCVAVNDGSRAVCVCPTGFNGTRCEFRQPSVCDLQPCGSNGNCTLNGSLAAYTCVCEKGFRGDRCEQIDYCASNPCFYGRCVPTQSGYKCRCPNGRAGDRCELDVSECRSNPCKRGRCINEIGSYRCECPPGYSGRHCEYGPGSCDSSPCSNGAKCYSYRNGHYTCECRPGFTGRHCEVNIDDCSGHACMNGAVCVDGEQGYYCRCLPGFTGKFCETDIDECELGEHLCQNGGTCVNKRGGYNCICVNGWEGDNCEINKDDCIDALCEAGSTCLDHVAKYTCLCPPGKIGLLCHIDDPCLSNPCKAGSECEADTSTGKFICTCPKGYKGSDCSEDINECELGNNVCWNGGTCVNTPGSWHCECPAGFTDPWCMSHVNQCQPSPCQNQGTCLDYGSSIKCVCMSGFHGEYCEKRCPPGFEGENCERHQYLECNSTNCLNGGVCSKGTCRCPRGFTGERCETRTDPCKYHMCAPNAVCHPSSDGINYRCECKLGYFGADCRQELSECASNPCQHGGKCTDTADGFVCGCTPGYTGERCQKNVDDCAHEPCLHGGTCIDGINSYTCHCLLPFDGDRCQFEMNPCRGNRCQNNALCQPTSNYRSYTCNCTSGFEGKFCEMDIDECSFGNPCKNGGKCVNTHGSHRCRCPEGFVGPRCEINYDDCSPSPCANDGRCIDEVNGFRCECLAGFTGRQCTTNIDECEAAPCKNGASCVDQVNGYKCVCRTGFSGVHCEINDDDCIVGVCLNGGTCEDGVNSYRCRCLRNFTGKNCQLAVDMDMFNKTDIIERSECEKHDCERRASNGICDAVCNYYACGYDGGDCSAGTQPYERCAEASFCSHSFHNGECDPACDNEECLFDGRDCLSSSCLEKAYCADRFGDGHCDPRCNNVGCGWDGGDCEVIATLLAGELQVVLLINPEDFIQRAQATLLMLSQKLRATVRIRFKGGVPMIYKWNSESGVGPLVDVSPDKIHLLTGELKRSKRKAGHPLSGTMVVLMFDITRCIRDDRNECFKDLNSIARYLGAASARGELDEDLGMPLYSARVELPRESPESTFSYKTALISVGVMVAITAVAFVVVQQGRKRKTIHAPIWYPQPDSCKSSMTDLRGSYQFPLCPAKRSRLPPVGSVSPNDYVPDVNQILDPRMNEQSWTILHEEANSKRPISSKITRSLVNKKGKGGRTALMQTACNQEKSEADSIEDIRKLLEAGAEIDAKDDSEDTALMLAVKSGRAAVVKFLLEMRADPCIVDDQDRTALHHAVAIQSVEIVRLLLMDGRINVDALDVNNQTALIICAKYDMMGPEIAEMLLQERADVGCAGDKQSTHYDGKTALHFAAQLGNREIIKVLIKHDANKDAQDQMDQTPLFLAASEGHLEAVQLLISLGASKEITDQTERSPRDVAAEKCFREVVDFLDSAPPHRIMPAPANIGMMPQQNRLKKSIKKPNMKSSVKKNPSPSFPPCSSSQSTVNPLTPPLSDGSNYSSTPSPNSVHPPVRNVHQGVHPEGALHSSSVMLSPYSDHQNGVGCSPPQMVMQTGWPQTELPGLRYDDSHCFPFQTTVMESYNQRVFHTIYPQQHTIYPHMRQPSHYNV